MSGEFPFYPPLFITLMTAFATAIIAANWLLLGLMIWQKSLRVVPNFFLGSLAVSDLISGLVGIPLCMACFWQETMTLCVSSALSVRFTAISSVCHMLLIAGDRYTMIVHPMKYRSLVTKPRAIGAISAIWLLAFAASVVQLSWYVLNEDADEIEERTARIDTVYIVLCLVVFFALPLCLMVYLYGRVFAISIAQVQTVRKLGFKARKRHKSIISNYRGVVALVSMLIVFSICWLPFFVVALLDHIQATVTVPPVVQIINIFLRFTVPLSNPLICTYGKRDLNSALRRLWHTCFKRRCAVTVRFRKSSIVCRRRFTEGELDQLNTDNPASPRIKIDGLPRCVKEMNKT